jgi:hypothetical protein
VALAEEGRGGKKGGRQKKEGGRKKKISLQNTKLCTPSQQRGKVVSYTAQKKKRKTGTQKKKENKRRLHYSLLFFFFMITVVNFSLSQSVRACCSSSLSYNRKRENARSRFAFPSSSHEEPI